MAVGWMYEYAVTENQQYKEGLTVLEKAAIVKVNDDDYVAAQEMSTKRSTQSCAGTPVEWLRPLLRLRPDDTLWLASTFENCADTIIYTNMMTGLKTTALPTDRDNAVVVTREQILHAMRTSLMKGHKIDMSEAIEQVAVTNETACSRPGDMPVCRTGIYRRFMFVVSSKTIEESCERFT